MIDFALKKLPLFSILFCTMYGINRESFVRGDDIKVVGKGVVKFNMNSNTFKGQTVNFNYVINDLLLNFCCCNYYFLVVTLPDYLFYLF